MSRPAVELHEAYIWTCDDCGQDNFGRMIELEPDSELIPESLRSEVSTFASIQRAHGVGGAFLTRPSRVACLFCGSEFDVDDGE